MFSKLINLGFLNTIKNNINSRWITRYLLFFEFYLLNFYLKKKSVINLVKDGGEKKMLLPFVFINEICEWDDDPPHLDVMWVIY